MPDKQDQPPQSLDLSALSNALQDAGQPWEMAYTSMTALDEPEREVRLGVPARPELEGTEESRPPAQALPQLKVLEPQRLSICAT